MPGYRFCRTDDVPLLVDAVNACASRDAASAPPFTIEAYKVLVRELSLWASSCMLAMEGGTPIGVMLAAKRERATLIQRLVIHPAHRRRGHGAHLLRSLSSKLAILGPPRLVAEVPASRVDLRAFVEACGYRPSWEAADFEMEAREPAPLPPLAASVRFDDIREAGLLADQGPRAWQRSLETLANRSGQLQGLAIAAGDRPEAWLLHRDDPFHEGRLEIAALGCGPTAQARALMAIMVSHLAGRQPAGLSLRAVTADEIDPALLVSWGFRRTGGWIGYEAEAAPA